MSYIWIKYSPYSDGTEMTDNINDFTKVHTYEAILDSSTNTDWTDIVFKIRQLNGSVQISDIEITIDGDSTNYYTGENLDITTDNANYWVALSVNDNSNLIGKRIKVKFNFIVSQRTSNIYFLTFFNNDLDNSNNRYDILDVQEVIKMKRTKLDDRELPDYTRGEEIFNMVTHIVGAAFGVAALVLCIIF